MSYTVFIRHKGPESGPGSSGICTICPMRRAEVSEAIKNFTLIASSMFLDAIKIIA